MKISLIISMIISMQILLFLPARADTVSENKVPACEAYRSEQRKFVAMVCDEVCPNAPYLCKVAFCSVIINRIDSGAFPNTAAEVVMTDPIFSKAHNTSFEISPSESSLMAYDDAISGFSPYPGLLYYYVTDCANLTLKRRQTLFQIGRYVFS